MHYLRHITWTFSKRAWIGLFTNFVDGIKNVFFFIKYQIDHHQNTYFLLQPYELQR